MKKVFTTTLIALAFGAHLHAQSNKGSNEAVFGIRGAFNLSSLTTKVSGNGFGSGSTETVSQPGFAAGFFFEAPISSGFSIQPEVNFSSKGGKYGDNNAFSAKGYHLNLNYITVPVLLKWNPIEVKGFNIFAGPEVGFLISAKTKYILGNSSSSLVINGESNNIKVIDLDLDLGLGYDFVPNFGMDVRYELGLTNISKSYGSSQSGSSSLKNKTVQIGLRYLFR